MRPESPRDRLPEGIAIRIGLPASQQLAAAHLYWQAFGQKLGRLLGPEAAAIELLSQAVRPDHALVALDPAGRLVAMAGFRSDRGGFMPLSGGNLARVYGRWGGYWRRMVLRLLKDTEHDMCMLVEGVAVDAGWRDRGIGAALIDALAVEARARGYDGLRLEVSNDNHRARALYERLGFSMERRQRLWLLAPVFRMSGSTVMRRAL